MNIPTLTTSRLTLRPFTEADAEPLHRILNEDGILRYFPRPDPPDLARVERLIAGQLRHWEEHGLGWWAVELRSTSELARLASGAPPANCSAGTACNTSRTRKKWRSATC